MTIEQSKILKNILHLMNPGSFHPFVFAMGSFKIKCIAPSVTANNWNNHGGSSLSEIRLIITFNKTLHSIQVLIQAPPGADHGATCSKGSKDTI